MIIISSYGHEQENAEDVSGCYIQEFFLCDGGRKRGKRNSVAVLHPREENKGSAMILLVTLNYLCG